MPAVVYGDGSSDPHAPRCHEFPLAALVPENGKSAAVNSRRRQLQRFRIPALRSVERPIDGLP
jgi:hypothetical protein